MRQIERLPKMVIFDCDGVVVDSEPLTNKAPPRDCTGALVFESLMHDRVFGWQSVGTADPIANDQALTARRDGHDVTI